jgi:magnesium chelatase family protein
MTFPSPLDAHSSEALLRAAEQQLRKLHPLPPLERIDLLNQVLSLLQALDLPGPLLPLTDMAQLRGNYHVHRALEVAAAGNHAILLVGGIGAGKATMVRCLPTLLPTREQHDPWVLALASHQESSLDYGTLVAQLRLACGGILHLEHLSQFRLWQLEAIRRANLEHLVTLPESHTDLRLPNPFLLAATVEPCPCGNYGDQEKACICSADAIIEHHLRLHDLIHSCFDLHVEVGRPGGEQLLDTRGGGEPSERVAARVKEARDHQARRYADQSDLHTNAELVTLEDAERYTPLDHASETLLKAAIRMEHVGARELIRIRRVARTIADLAGSEHVRAQHVAEALHYRSRW